MNSTHGLSEYYQSIMNTAHEYKTVKRPQKQDNNGK